MMNDGTHSKAMTVSLVVVAIGASITLLGYWMHSAKWIDFGMYGTTAGAALIVFTFWYYAGSENPK